MAKIERGENEKLESLLKELREAPKTTPQQGDAQVADILKNLKTKTVAEKEVAPAKAASEKEPAPVKEEPVKKPVGTQSAPVAKPQQSLQQAFDDIPLDPAAENAGMVDDAFREFFTQTVSIDKAAIEQARREKKEKGKKPKRTSGSFWRQEQPEDELLQVAKQEEVYEKESFFEEEFLEEESFFEEEPFEEDSFFGSFFKSGAERSDYEDDETDDDADDDDAAWAPFWRRSKAQDEPDENIESASAAQGEPVQKDEQQPQEEYEEQPLFEESAHFEQSQQEQPLFEEPQIIEKTQPSVQPVAAQHQNASGRTPEEKLRADMLVQQALQSAGAQVAAQTPAPQSGPQQGAQPQNEENIFAPYKQSEDAAPAADEAPVQEIAPQQDAPASADAFNNEVFASMVSASVAGQIEDGGEYSGTLGTGDEMHSEEPIAEAQNDYEEPFTDDDGEDAPPPQEYENTQDAPEILLELKSKNAAAKLRLAVSALAAAFSVYTALAVQFALPLPAVVKPAGTNTMGYIALNLALLVLACAANLPTIIAGFKGLAQEPTADSLSALSAGAALLQALGLLAMGGYDVQNAALFAPVAAGALFFNALGKAVISADILENFIALSSEEEYAAAYILDDAQTARELGAGLGEREPVFALSRPTGLIKGFLRHSYSPHKSEALAKKMAIFAAVCAVFCGLLSAYLTKNAVAALSSFAAAAVLGGSFSAVLVRAVPGRLMQDAAAQAGAVIPGYSAMEQLSTTNITIVDDAELFPEGTILLHGMKTFEKERIDLAILYTASVLIKANTPFKGIFMGVIENNLGMLYETENITEERGYGYTAWIENNRVLVGNREHMQHYGVEIPSMDYEEKYTKGVRQPIYLSLSGRLFGMFVVSHQPSEEMQETLEDVVRRGIAIEVTGHNFTLTSQAVAGVYGLPQDYVKVLSGAEREILQPYAGYAPESDGAMAHVVGSFSSFFGGVRAAAGGMQGEKSAAVVQSVGIGFAGALAVLLTVTGGLARVSPVALLTYNLAWLLMSVLIAFAKKY